MKKLLIGLVLSLLAVPGWSQTYFTIFGPAAGIQKNNGSTPFNTAAASSDITALWSGTCSTTTFLRGDGSCAIPTGTGVSSVTVASPLAASGGCSSGACSITWTATLGDIHYGSGANTIGILAGNTTTTKQFLTQTGTGTVSAAPAWGTIATGDLPISGANPTGTIGLTAVNGSATNYIRSDGAPALSQAISPTWSGTHTFSNAITVNGGGSSLKGGVTVVAPASSIQALTVNGASGLYTEAVQTSGLTAGNSFGLIVTAGTNSSDNSLLVRNQAATHNYAFVAGDGSFGLGFNGTTNTLNGAAAGNISISAPSNGNTLTSTAVNTAFAARFNGGSTTGQSFGLQIVAGTNSSDFAAQILNQAASSSLLVVYGDGGVVIGNNPTGGDKGAGTLNTGSTIFQNNVPVATVTTGSATLTLSTGCTTTPTVTANWTLNGDIATLTFQSGVSCTSNSINFQFTGIPLALQPTHVKVVTLIGAEDNGAVHQLAEATIAAATSGTLTLNLCTFATAANCDSNWTASGTKGLVPAGIELIWSID